MTEAQNSKPALVVLAAGIGSRYGGLKQIDPVGPSGEAVIEYSIYDAIQSGYGKVVFVIRPELEKEFENILAPRFHHAIDVAYAHQQLSDIPEGCTCSAERAKPWGTGQAVWAARHEVHEPFAVINADDFYGRSSFAKLGDALSSMSTTGNRHAMVAFTLRNTTSAHGPVSRGVCSVDGNGKLSDVTERVHIEEKEGSLTYHDGDHISPLTGSEPVSMNMWGFSPSIFAALERAFTAFMSKHADSPKREFFAPAVVDELIKNGKAEVDVLHSNDTWLGITYPDDRERVATGIRELIDAGIYPENLWD